MCAIVFKEAISYYACDSSTVFCCFFDATTAFDRVHYSTLFRQLDDRRLHPRIVRIPM
jgi:hypothetical protein